MSDWSGVTLKVYNQNNDLTYQTSEIIEASGSQSWMEIGRGAYVIVPVLGSVNWIRFRPDYRVEVFVINTAAATGHTICDFIIEEISVEEYPLETGGMTNVMRVAGRDQIKLLAEAQVGVRHISKWRTAGTATAITATTLQMNATDTAAFNSMSLIGWTIELEDGNWSRVTGHTSGGLITIDPAWQKNASDTEDSPTPPPPVQRWRVYGGAVSETTGNNTDLKLAFSMLPQKLGWSLDQYTYQSTANGSYLSCVDYSVFKTLQQIAAQAGEYFVRVPGARRLLWRREIPAVTHPQYGSPLALIVPATTPADYSVFENAFILPGAELSLDVAERATRVRPSGGGGGDEAVTLRNLPTGFTPAAGYQISGEYLIHTASEAGVVVVSKELRFDSIAPANDNPAAKQLAAQALYNAALAWFKERQIPRLVLNCEVISAIPIAPVTYVNVHMPEHGLFYNKMYVLSSTTTYKNGYVVYALQLSDKKAPILDDERLIAQAIRETSLQVFTYNAPSRNSRRIDTGGKSETGGGGGDSHPPVTSGNAAINVATEQVVSLSLAGPSGMEIATGGLRLADSVAGNGLGISNKVLSINVAADGGLAIASDALKMDTPGTLTSTSTNQLTGGHTHAITAFSDGKANTGGLLKSSAQGDLTLRWLTADKAITPVIETSSGGLLLDPAGAVVNVDGNLSFVGARQIATSSGSLTLAPAQTLIIDPPDDVAQINSAVTLKTAHWSSGFLGTGWGITYDGEMDMRKIYADELHVMAFIADTARVKVGAEYITPSMALTSRRFTIPNVGSSATLYVEDAPGLTDLPVFSDGDWVLLRIIDRSGGGLLVANAWGQVYAYSDLSGGEQSWTFTTRNTTANGKSVERGVTALDFGKTGDGWWWVTTLDPAGSPYAGITTWTGDNPYTEGNRTHRLRMGQLRGVTGANEWGLQAGTAMSSFVRFTDLRSEIHGSRLSLYAGDGAQLRVCAAAITFFKTAGSSVVLTPDADHNAVGVESTHGTFYQTVDEATGSPNLSDYIRNAGNRSGMVTLGLSNPTSFTNIHKIRFDYVIAATGFSTDTIRLYAQVMAADEVTPLTGEMLVVTRTANTTSLSGNIDLPHDSKAVKADWDGARLKLRWEYEISAVSEAIRLDPNVPSFGVGNPLPTGVGTGGAGFWVGLEGGQYKLRLGTPGGQALRWDGGSLWLQNSNGDRVIEFDSSGNSKFTGAMSIDTAGGIWQGTGTWGSPTNGLKIWNYGGIGRISTYDSGGLRLTLRHDRGLEIVNSGTSTDSAAITFAETAGGTIYGGLYGYKNISSKAIETKSGNARSLLYSTGSLSEIYLFAGNTYIEMSSNKRIDFYIDSSTQPLRLNVDGTVAYMPISIYGGFSGWAGGALNISTGTDRAIALNNQNVTHGMTDYAPTSMYGWFKPVDDADGGLEAWGATEKTIGVRHFALATLQDTTTTSSSTAAYVIDARRKSGTGATGLGDTSNLFAIRNYGGTKFIVKGNGDIHAGTYTDAFDEHNDVGLIRALERHLGGTAYDAAWDDMIAYDADNLRKLGLIGNDGLVNVSAWLRLLSGAIWQLYRGDK